MVTDAHRDLSAAGPYDATRSRVQEYFDTRAAAAWRDLTGEARVSRIRETVRAGRTEMRDLILSRLPADLTGMRVLDAGCGTGAKAEALALRGAEVVAVDVAAAMLTVAQDRLDPAARPRVRFLMGDMFDRDLGRFDAVVAQDSMIYYRAAELTARLDELRGRAGLIVTSLAPRTPLLQTMFWAGKAFPRRDRSPAMVPHDMKKLAARLDGTLLAQVSSGFYISTALELRA
ncbi:magnesium protoporphyrin IX methyltransferase [Jannaschia seohaensis]|uniref:Magnesium protoporphyrin IX methyltransferase n=1 Tax=Jannaschia seohaensis TaxID=475081 RepID=A0A2Y9BVV2_9RHOB|nr:magnesium protoporphyrin IX methyltransferase [Jannaschia seohaensis]PWJ21704.1 magnesium-protoporphyrin O-methyltransferase [Jannaschia seohaensis]SSA37982.1 magnesium-protoporphyrin O-methyltransferase [Jannaschia seohaensis]